MNKECLKKLIFDFFSKKYIQMANQNFFTKFLLNLIKSFILSKTTKHFSGNFWLSIMKKTAETLKNNKNLIFFKNVYFYRKVTILYTNFQWISFQALVQSYF